MNMQRSSSQAISLFEHVVGAQQLSTRRLKK